MGDEQQADDQKQQRLDQVSKFFGPLLKLGSTDQRILSEFNLANILINIARKDDKWFENLGGDELKLSKSTLAFFRSYTLNTSKLINQLRTAEYSEQEASDLKDIIVDIAQTNNVDTILQKQIEDLRISLQSDLKKSVKLIEASIYKSYLTAQKDNNCLLSPTKPLTTTALNQIWNDCYEEHVECVFKSMVPESSTCSTMKDAEQELDNWKAIQEDADEKEQHKSFARLLNRLHGPSSESTTDPSSNLEQCFGGLVWYTSEYGYIKSKAHHFKPDFTCHIGDNIKNIFGCAFVFELFKKQGEQNFDNEHKAKILIYNEAILNANPLRSFIISILTNMEQIMFIKSRRIDEDRNFYKYEHSYCELEFVKAIKMLHYALLNPEAMGYVSPPPEIRIGHELFCVE